MSFEALAVLYLPVVVWAGLGFALAVSFGRSGSSTLFRLTALFLGVWALLATTALAWVLAHGGGPAVVRLAESPMLLFEPASALVWVAGALGAFAVFLSAFVLSQAVGRGFLRLFPSRELPGSSGRRPEAPSPSPCSSAGVLVGYAAAT